MAGTFRSVLSLGTLGETRRILRSSRAWVLTIPLAASYAIVSMVIGGMLLIGATGLPYYWEVLVAGPGAQNWWNYPAVVAVTPWAIFDLPFFPTITMALVSVAVGIASTATLVLVFGNTRAFHWLFARRRGSMSAGVGAAAAAGTAPAIAGIATLGACCCTSCASVAGVSVVAATSGTTLARLLENSWYLSVFQLGVVVGALLVQERAIRRATTDCPVPPPKDSFYFASSVLRLGLMIAGVTWSLAMLVEWIGQPPLSAPAATWYHWVFEHQLLAGLAIGAAVLPREFYDAVVRRARTGAIVAVRAGALVAGVSWGLWVPPALAQKGVGGFLNELFGYLGYPGGIGAIPPDSPLGAALLFHWAFQHLLLASFAISFALVPHRVGSVLLWSIEPRGIASPAPASPPPPSHLELPPRQVPRPAAASPFPGTGDAEVAAGVGD